MVTNDLQEQHKYYVLDQYFLVPHIFFLLHLLPGVSFVFRDAAAIVEVLTDVVDGEGSLDGHGVMRHGAGLAAEAPSFDLGRHRRYWEGCR